MKKKRFGVEQIVGVLKQAEVGVPVAEVIRKVGISEQTFYRWKAKYVGLEVDQVRQMKQLQEENLRLKQLVAELTLDKTMLAGRALKKMVKPSRRGPMVEHLASSYRSSERHACRVLCVARARIAIEAIWIHGLSCGCGSARSHRQECATDTARSAYC